MPDDRDKVFISYRRSPDHWRLQRDISVMIGQRDVLVSPDTNLLELPFRIETAAATQRTACPGIAVVIGGGLDGIWPVGGTPTFVSGSSAPIAPPTLIPATPVDSSILSGVVPYRPLQQLLLGVGNQLRPSPLRSPAPWILPFYGSQSSSRLRPFGLNAALPAEPTTPSIEPLLTRLPAQATPGATQVIRLHLDAKLRADLLRLVGGILAACCRALILMHAALSRRMDACSFVLVLVATSRRYGHRTEPDHYLLPDHRPMSVVRGGLVLAC